MAKAAKNTKCADVFRKEIMAEILEFLLVPSLWASSESRMIHYSMSKSDIEEMATYNDMFNSNVPGSKFKQFKKIGEETKDRSFW